MQVTPKKMQVIAQKGKKIFDFKKRANKVLDKKKMHVIVTAMEAIYKKASHRQKDCHPIYIEHFSLFL